MTMPPEAAVTMMNSVKGFNTDMHKCGVQNPQLSQSVKPRDTDEQNQSRNSDLRSYGQKDAKLNTKFTEESRMEGISSELVSSPGFDNPLLPRVNRLNTLLDYLQDKRTTPSTTMNGNFQHSILKFEENTYQESCKPISWVLQEIQTKGTILDRIATLESRVTKLAEEVERRKASKQCINVMEGVRLHLNGSSGCDVFVKEKKVGVAPTLPCESVEKGLHEQFSRRVLHDFETPKDEGKQVGMKNAMGKKEDEKRSERKGKGKGKGKLCRMLPDCMVRPST